MLGRDVAVDTGYEVEQAVHQARLAELLRRLPERDARHEVGHDAQAQVLEAPEQSRGPISGLSRHRQQSLLPCEGLGLGLGLEDLVELSRLYNLL